MPCCLVVVAARGFKFDLPVALVAQIVSEQPERAPALGFATEGLAE